MGFSSTINKLRTKALDHLQLEHHLPTHTQGSTSSGESARPIPPGEPVWEERWDDTWRQRWTVVEASGGFGNNELQTYTSSPANIDHESSSLRIKAVSSAGGGFTSAKIMSNRTLDTESFYVEIDLPQGVPWNRAIWSAIWLLPRGFENTWPTGGEIDLLEVFGPQPGEAEYSRSKMAMCAHWAHHHLPHGHSRTDVDLDTRKSFVVGLAGSGYSLTWYLDGVPRKSCTVPALGAGVDRSGFASLGAFSLVLNIAMGGTATQHQQPAPGTYPMTVGAIRQFTEPPGGWEVFGKHHAQEQRAGRYS